MFFRAQIRRSNVHQGIHTRKSHCSGSKPSKLSPSPSQNCFILMTCNQSIGHQRGYFAFAMGSMWHALRFADWRRATWTARWYICFLCPFFFLPVILFNEFHLVLIIEVKAVLHEPPRRVLAPLPFSPISVSDYLFPGEGPADSLTSLADLLDLGTLLDGDVQVF